MAETSISLCISCSRATASLCPWLAAGDRTELTYTTRTVRCPRWGEAGTIELVTVTSCPRYRPGPLPPLDRRKFSGSPAVGRATIGALRWSAGQVAAGVAPEG